MPSWLQFEACHSAQKTLNTKFYHHVPIQTIGSVSFNNRCKVGKTSPLDECRLEHNMDKLANKIDG